MKIFGLILTPILILTSYLVFGFQYYSVLTTYLFSIYFTVLIILGTNKVDLKWILLSIFVIFTLLIQWYGIKLTLRSIEEMNNNPGYYEYGSDFVVLFSWLLLIVVSVKLNINAYKKTKKIFKNIENTSND